MNMFRRVHKRKICIHCCSFCEINHHDYDDDDIGFYDNCRKKIIENRSVTAKR